MAGARIIHGGVAANESVVTYDTADTNAYAISQAGDRTAPAITLAGLLKQLGGCDIDLLKMDIGGRSGKYSPTGPRGLRA